MLKNTYKCPIRPDEVFNLLKDNNSILEIFLGSFTFFTSKKILLSKIFDHKIKKLDQPTKIIESPLIDFNIPDFNINQIDDEIVKRVIIHFEYVIKNNIDSNNLKLFYKNINSLTLKRVKNTHNRYTIAYYSPYNNTIVYKIDDLILFIYHELFHLSSCYMSDEAIYIGFSQLKDGIYVGEGINEGYTQLLSERYFNETIKSYNFQKYVATHIEKVIGKEKMMQFYFTADLKSLVVELNKYLDANEIFYLINSLDFYTKENRKKDTKKFGVFEDNLTLKTQKILFKMYLAKYKESINENTKSNKELLNDIQEIIDSLDYTISDSKDSFTYKLDKSDILSEFKSNFPKRTKIKYI